MEAFFVLKASIFCKVNESVFEDEPSPDWKGAEGVKKLQFFMDERCFWAIIFYRVKMGCNFFMESR